MNDDDTTTLLNGLAERVDVGPVPLQDVIRSGQKARARRRRTAAVLAAAAVALVLLGGVGIRQALQPGRPVPVAAGPAAPAPRAPAGTRLVGIGHAAIAVPADWGTNEVTCGKPISNTVVVDQGPVTLCATTLPQTVSDVRVEVPTDAQTSAGFSAAATVSVDGVPALRTPLQCTRQTGPAAHGYRLCTQAVWVQQEHAVFTATSPHARTVRRLIGSVRVEKGYVAVPATYTSDATRTSRSFISAAEALGLKTDTRVVRGSGWPAGWIVGVEPAVGTLLRPGATAHVTVSAGPGPQDQGTASSGTASSGTASSGTASSGTTMPGSTAASGAGGQCSLTPAVQRLTVTRSVLPGNHLTFGFPSQVTVRDPAAISPLADALCAAPRIPRGAVYSCPNDNGLAYHLAAFDGSVRVWDLDVHGSGCLFISGMDQGRRSTGRIWRSLAAALGVSPPTYQTLAGHPAR